mmetsp:Transcript_97707/g.173153  ORF Transcript_97707/g.173153 Transcript_97707/m.173153 type:complete len:453 (+) Transcript_97707:86-1444(+)
MASPKSEILEFWSSGDWVDIWSGLPLKVPPLGSAAGLVRNALLPGSSVNFPQITEICERIVEEPSEARDAVNLLTAALSDTYASFQKKLKALTICNEMMYDDSLVIMFSSAERLRDALLALRSARDTGLGAPIDENIRMLATEVDKVVFPLDGQQQPKRISRISESVKSNLGKAAGILRRDSSDRAGAMAAPQAAPPHAPFQTSAPTQMPLPSPATAPPAAPPPAVVAPPPLAPPVSSKEVLPQQAPPQLAPPPLTPVPAPQSSPPPAATAPPQAVPAEAVPRPCEAAPAPWDSAPAPWENAAADQVAAPVAAPPMAPAPAMPAVAASEASPATAPAAAAPEPGLPAPGPPAAPRPPAPASSFEFPAPPAFLAAGPAVAASMPAPFNFPEPPAFLAAAAAVPAAPVSASGTSPSVASGGGHSTVPLPSGPAPWDVPSSSPTPATGGGLEAMF